MYLLKEYLRTMRKSVIIIFSMKKLKMKIVLKMDMVAPVFAVVVSPPAVIIIKLKIFIKFGLFLHILQRKEVAQKDREHSKMQSHSQIIDQ